MEFPVPREVTRNLSMLLNALVNGDAALMPSKNLKTGEPVILLVVKYEQDGLTYIKPMAQLLKDKDALLFDNGGTTNVHKFGEKPKDLSQLKETPPLIPIMMAPKSDLDSMIKEGVKSGILTPLDGGGFLADMEKAEDQEFDPLDPDAH